MKHTLPETHNIRQDGTSYRQTGEHILNVNCTNCGRKLPIDKSLIKTLVGGSMISGAALGWTSYAFAGILGFSGGAALIAIALLAGGGTILSGKDFGIALTIGTKISDLLTAKNYLCPSCGHSNWAFSGLNETEVIAGADHKNELTGSFSRAQKTLIIASGFVSSNVVNDYFLNNLAATLNRGITVTLIYSDQKSHSDWMNSGYKNATSELSRLVRKYPNLKLIEKHTHQKALIVDDLYAIVGSFNFLSNEKVARHETSMKIFEPDRIEEVKRQILLN